MKVQNIKNSQGRVVPNQFVISEEGRGANGNFLTRETFQSYNSIIAVRTVWDNRVDIKLDEYYWDYSKTTGKYHNQFLRETKAETQKKIDSGEYKLVNLNN